MGLFGSIVGAVTNPIGTIANAVVPGSGNIVNPIGALTGAVAGGPSVGGPGGAPNALTYKTFTPGAASGGITRPSTTAPLPAFNLGSVYQAKDYSGELPGFAQQKNDASSQNSTALSTANDALERKFASMGNVNSGAYVKQSNLLGEQYAQQGAKTQNDISTQESQQRQQLQSAEDQKVFQSQQAYNQNQFAASGQTRQEQISANQADFDNQTKLTQLDLALYGAQQQSTDSQFNSELAAYQAKNSGGLLGSGGVLGSGF